jgi:hypothetical protein
VNEKNETRIPQGIRVFCCPSAKLKRKCLLGNCV